MSDRHFLVVHEEPDDGMEIEHPDGCPTELRYDGRVLTYTCPVGQIEDAIGLEDEWFSRDDADSGLEYTPPGQYVIQAWEDRIQLPPFLGGGVEWNTGLALVKDGTE